jgi:hypothetical protein
MAPQLRIAEDGQVVLDVTSLTVQAQQQELDTYERVDEKVRRRLRYTTKKPKL